MRIAVILVPGLSRFRPTDLIKEIWTNLRRETDFRQEARNIRRFAEALKGWKTVAIPQEIEGLDSESVLVQEMSGGRSIDDLALAPEGPRLAQAFVDAVARALKTALAMPLDERRARWTDAMTGVRKDDIHAWRRSFLGALRQTRAGAEGAMPVARPARLAPVVMEQAGIAMQRSRATEPSPTRSG